MLKIKPNVFAGLIVALLIIVPLISVVTIRYEPLLGDSPYATIFKDETFAYVCFIALYGIGYALINFFFWIIKEIDSEFHNELTGGNNGIFEHMMFILLLFCPLFVMTFLYPLMNYITNY